jgi:hypothetical protein
LVQDSGEVAIIDFDQAKLGASEDKFRDEYEDLRDLLEDLVEPAIEAEEDLDPREAQVEEKASTAGETETVGTSRVQTRGHTRIAVGVEKVPKPKAQYNETGKTGTARKVDAISIPEVQTKSKAKKEVRKGEVELKRKVSGAAVAGTSKAKPRRHARVGNVDSVSKQPRMAGEMVLRSQPPQVRR